MPSVCLNCASSFTVFPSEAPGGHGGSSQPGVPSSLQCPCWVPSVSPCPRSIQGCLSPLWKMFHCWCLAQCPRCPLYSCTAVTGGVVLWCLQGRERETGADAPLQEPHRHFAFRKGHCPAVAGACSLAPSCPRSTKTRGHPRISQQCPQAR